jgi:hypothetical protein
MFLPGQIPPLEVLIEFRFLRFQHRKVSDIGKRNFPVTEDLSIAGKLSTEFEDFRDSFKPPLPGYKNPSLPFLPQYRRVEKSSILDRDFEFLKSFRFELLALTFGLDDDGTEVN